MAFDLIVFNRQVYTTMTELVDQQVALFNEASRGSIILMPAANAGDFNIAASFKLISGLVRRRNAYGSGNVAVSRLTQLQNASVKVAAGTPPLQFEPQQYKWIQLNPELAALTIGEQLAKASMQDMLNSAIRAAAAAINNNSGVATPATGAVNSFLALNTASSKFGDRAGNLVAWIMHSKVMFDLYANALTNTQRLFNYGTISVITDPFGRLFVVSDSPALVNAGPTYTTLGLQEGGAMVQTNGDFDAVMQDVPGQENIQRVYQAEWTYNLAVLGYTWDIANGGKSPNDTAIGTGTNWDQTATSIKDTAGISIITN